MNATLKMVKVLTNEEINYRELKQFFTRIITKDTAIARYMVQYGKQFIGHQYKIAFKQRTTLEISPVGKVEFVSVKDNTKIQISIQDNFLLVSVISELIESIKKGNFILTNAQQIMIGVNL